MLKGLVSFRLLLLWMQNCCQKDSSSACNIKDSDLHMMKWSFSTQAPEAEA